MKTHRDVAVVTGGAGGLGMAIGQLLGERGAAVVLVDVDERGFKLADELRDEGVHAHFKSTDVTDPVAVTELVQWTVEELGGIDGLVNAAGISHFGALESVPLSDFRKVLEVNLVSTFQCLQAVGAVMLEQGGGAIVNISSIGAGRGAPGRGPYCVSKAGVEALTRVASAEWSSRRVRVNAIAPGYVDTPMYRSALNTGAIEEAAVRSRIPAGRPAQPHEVAAVAAFLLSPEASYISGATIAVDGGFLIDHGVPSRSVADTSTVNSHAEHRQARVHE